MIKFRTKYLIRLDDACHQMPLEKWNHFIDFFDQNHIKPIIGVIPQNNDKSLGGSYIKNFWDLVCGWQKKGWSIAMHGYTHECHPISSKESYFNFGNKSEFVSISLIEQRKKIRQSLSIFRKNKIEPELFMSPSHTFDRNTLTALKEETSIRIITDGFTVKPFKKDGFLFIPQQLWSVKKPPFGLFTICIHPTTMNESEIQLLLEKIESITKNIIGVEDLNLKKIKKYNITDSLFTFIYKILLRFKFRS